MLWPNSCKPSVFGGQQMMIPVIEGFLMLLIFNSVYILHLDRVLYEQAQPNLSYLPVNLPLRCPSDCSLRS